MNPQQAAGHLCCQGLTLESDDSGWKYQKTWLVVEPYPSEEYEFVKWDDCIPNWMESHKIPWFQATNKKLIGDPWGFDRWKVLDRVPCQYPGWTLRFNTKSPIFVAWPWRSKGYVRVVFQTRRPHLLGIYQIGIQGVLHGFTNQRMWNWTAGNPNFILGVNDFPTWAAWPSSENFVFSSFFMDRRQSYQFALPIGNVWRKHQRRTYMAPENG